MQLDQRRIGYGMLAFRICGHAPELEGQAIVDYRLRNPSSKLELKPDPTRWNENVYRSFERHLLAEYPLPEALIQSIDKTLETIPIRCARVIEFRFGLIGAEIKTPAEIAEQIYFPSECLFSRPPLSRNLVRQLEARGIRLLRRPSRVKRIKPLLDNYLSISTYEFDELLDQMLENL